LHITNDIVEKNVSTLEQKREKMSRARSSGEQNSLQSFHCFI